MKSIIGIMFLIVVAESANWLTLQGTQANAGHIAWGFIQVRYEQNSGDTVIENGINKTPFSYIAPTLQKKSQFSLTRFRLGLRGSLDDENTINYFILTEFAPNGINNPLGEKKATYLTDASLTFKQLPLKIRIGKFKYPGSEEGLMTRFASPFINFTTLSNQLLLERFVSAELSKQTQGVGAFRDSGIQLFESFTIAQNSELSMAYMYGNGSGLADENINKGKATHYGYVSYEKLLGGGKGYKQESLKLYAWYQEGERYIESEQKFYERKREGVGVTYFYNGLHVDAEYAQGEGVIGNGVRDVSNDSTINEWQSQTSFASDSKASGYYVATTYEIIKKLELLARYDKYDRMINNKKLYRVFETLTTGFSYKLKNYNRVDVNYAINSIRAPYNSGADALLCAVGNQFVVQFTLLLK